MQPDGDNMERHLIEKRPSWWLLYVIAAVMVLLVALLETSVADERARITLEIVVVVMMFVLMLRWGRANRGRIELAEAGESRKSAVDTVLANGQPALADSRGPRLAWGRPRGRRQRA